MLLENYVVKKIWERLYFLVLHNLGNSQCVFTY